MAYTLLQYTVNPTRLVYIATLTADGDTSPWVSMPVGYINCHIMSSRSGASAYTITFQGEVSGTATPSPVTFGQVTEAAPTTTLAAATAARGFAFRLVATTVNSQTIRVALTFTR